MRLPAIALLVCAACGRVPSTAVPPAGPADGAADFGPTLFFPSEAMTWDIHWADVLMGGMSLAVGQPGTVEGRPGVVVRIEARTAGVLATFKKARSEVATMLDLETGVPLQVAGNIDDLYSGDIMDVDYEQKDVSLEWRPWRSSTPSGAPVTEVAGTLGWLRGWRGARGEKAHFFSEFRGRIYRVDVIARGGEVIRQRGEATRVQRVDGILTGMTYDMRPDLSDTYPFIGWGTDDERRVPVRIHVQNQWGGTVALEMTSYSVR